MNLQLSKYSLNKGFALRIAVAQLCAAACIYHSSQVGEHHQVLGPSPRKVPDQGRRAVLPQLPVACCYFLHASHHGRVFCS